MPNKDELQEAYEKGYKECLIKFIDLYIRQAHETNKLLEQSMEMLGITEGEENHARS